MPEHFHSNMTHYRPNVIENFDPVQQIGTDEDGNQWIVDGWFSDENIGKGKLKVLAFDDPGFESEWALVYHVTLSFGGLWTTYRLRG
jgi:hypothetical protein